MSNNNINMSIQPQQYATQPATPVAPQQTPVAPQQAPVAPQQASVAPQQASVAPQQTPVSQTSPNIEVHTINESENVSNDTGDQTTNNEAPTTITVPLNLLQNMKAIITVMHERQAVKLEEMVVVGNVYNNITSLLKPTEKSV